MEARSIRRTHARANDHRIGPWPLEWDVVTLCAALGLVGGPIVAAVGLLILSINTVLNVLTRTNHPYLQTAGTVLLVSIIPLLLLGGHCLDKLDERITNNLRS